MGVKQIVVVVGLAAAALGGTAAVPAMAQGGCGPFAHRGWDGFCHPGGGGFGYRPYPVYGFGYGYGPGWHRPWGWHRHGWGYYRRGW